MGSRETRQLESSTLHVRLLGRLGVDRGDGFAERWPRPAARRLVAILALAPTHAVGREVVAERLFGHLEADRALRNVSKALSQARSVVGSGVIEADSARLWINEGLTVVTDFEETLATLRDAGGAPPTKNRWSAIRSALDRGESLLAEDVYEEWAQEHLIVLSAASLEAAVALARASDEVEDWVRVTVRDPVSEEAWRALVRLFEKKGDRPGLSRVLARCRSAYGDLDMTMPPDLLETHRGLQEPAAREDASPPLIIGRDRELGVLSEVAREAAAGRGGSVLITGAAGLGKTHLLRVATARLQAEGYRVGAGASVVDDRDVPFAALRSALAPIVAGEVRRGSLLSRVLGGQPMDQDDESAGSIAGLVDEIAVALSASAVPTVVVLDDLHWADPAMTGVVMRLAATIAPRRWLLLMAARSDEPGHPIPPVPAHCRVVALAPLPPAESVDLARSLLEPDLAVDPAAAEAAIAGVVERSGGNPFFLTELLRSAGDGDPGPDPEAPAVPERVVALLRHRLTTVSADARAALALAALAGEVASYDLVAVPLGGERAAAAVGELQRQHLLRDEGGRPRLIHPLVREAVVATLSGPERAVVHGAIAAALEVGASSDQGREVDDHAAAHRLAAYEATRSGALAGAAALAAIAAGGRSLRMLAPEVAIGLLRRGLAAAEAAPADVRASLREQQFEGWMDLGNALVGLGKVSDARSAYDRARAMAESPAETARCIRAAAWFHYREGRFEAAEIELRAGLDQLPDTAEEARAALEIEIGWNLHRRGAVDEADPLLRRAATMFEDLADWTRAVLALDRFAMNLLALGQADEALEVLDRALALPASPSPKRRGILLIHRASVLKDLGRLDEALESVEAGGALLDRVHDPYMMSVRQWVAAEVFEARGDLEAALGARMAEIALLAEIGNDRHLSNAHRHRAELLARLGRHPEAMEASTAADHHEELAAATDRIDTDHPTASQPSPA